ncbi:MAG: hypothetical protein ABI132_04835 [Rhodanobacteraceae bacterium]
MKQTPQNNDSPQMNANERQSFVLHLRYVRSLWTDGLALARHSGASRDDEMGGIVA